MKNYIIYSLKLIFQLNLITLIITVGFHLFILALGEPFYLIMYPAMLGAITFIGVINVIFNYNFFINMTVEKVSEDVKAINENLKQINKLL